MIIDSSVAAVKFMAILFDVEDTERCSALVLHNEKGPIAGALYVRCTRDLMTINFWKDSDSIVTQDWSRTMFEYPFKTLGVKKLQGCILKTNKRSILLAEHAGFKLVRELEDDYVYELSPEDSKPLKWRRAV